LTYGQNATATGLIGLLAYTLYTRSSLNLSLEIRQAEIFPFLVLEKTPVEGDMTVRNVGGPAINFYAWSHQVTASFTFNGMFIENGGSTPDEFGGTLTKLQSIAMTPVASELGDRFLYVVDCHDTIGERHQFAMIREKVADGYSIYQVQMTHTTRFLPWRRRLIWKLREWKARRAARERIMAAAVHYSTPQGNS
jgi:hypothetical protein